MNLEEFKQKYKDEPELAGVIRYLISHGFDNRKIMFNFVEAKRKMELWHHKLNRAKEQNIGKTEIILSFDDGYYWAELQDDISKLYESEKMNNCVSTFNNDDHICSLRDKNNKPHISVYFKNGIAQEIRGIGNGTVPPKFLDKVIYLLNYVHAELPKNVLKIMGYIEPESNLANAIKMYFKGYKINTIFEKQYLYTGSKIKQVKKLDKFNIFLYDHLCKTMQCDAALKELVLFNNYDALMVTNVLLEQAIVDGDEKMVNYLLMNTNYTLPFEYLISLLFDFSYSWSPTIFTLLVDHSNNSSEQLNNILYQIYQEKFNDLINRKLFMRIKALIKNCNRIIFDHETVDQLNLTNNYLEGLSFLIRNGLDLKDPDIIASINELSSNKNDLKVLLALSK